MALNVGNLVATLSLDKKGFDTPNNHIRLMVEKIAILDHEAKHQKLLNKG